ncbi:hypothetical protein C8F04DRAFT_1080346, partial [Mycena alexandri]
MDSFSASPELYDLRLVSSIDVASLALLVSSLGQFTQERNSIVLKTYDTILNASREHRYIWKSKWSLVKCLYLWSRYAAFIDTTLAVLKRVDPSTDLSTCNIVTQFDTIFAGFGIALTEIILMVRTHALYGKSRKLLQVFIIMWLAIAAVSTWIVIHYYSLSNPATSTSGPSSIILCNLSRSSNMFLVCYCLLLFCETVIVLLTLSKAVHTFARNRGYESSHLMVTFYRDGIIFYVTMLLIFIFAVVFQIVGPPAIKYIGDTPLRVMHSVLACHLVIHVRAVASEDETNTLPTKSSLVFASLPVGSRHGVDTV